MRIGQINSLNFNGLWSEKQLKKLGRNDGFEPPVHLRKVVYHPFSDETQEEIQEAMKKAHENCVFSCYSNETINTERTPIYYISQTPSLGESLEITRADYEKIAAMREKNEPTANQFFTYHVENHNGN